MAALEELSCLRLIQSDNREMVIEMQAPYQADGVVMGHDSSGILSSSSVAALSQLSTPLRVKISFADADEMSRPVTGVEVNLC